MVNTIDVEVLENDEVAGEFAEPEAAASSSGYDYRPAPEEMQIPRLRLAQMLTPEVVDNEARGGQWLVPGTDAVDEVGLTLMGVKKTRVRSTRDSENRVQVLCSADSARGVPLVGVGDPGMPCDQCPFAQWSDENGKRTPPECTLVWRYLVQTEYGTAADLALSEKSASRAANEINAHFAQSGYRPGVVNLRLGSDLVTKNARRYYVPAVRGVTVQGGFARLGAGEVKQEKLRYTADGEAIDGGLTPVDVPRNEVRQHQTRQEATPRQIKYLWVTAREAEIDNQAVESMAEDLFGAPVEELDRRQISTLIEKVGEYKKLANA